MFFPVFFTTCRLWNLKAAPTGDRKQHCARYEQCEDAAHSGGNAEELRHRVSDGPARSKIDGDDGDTKHSNSSINWSSVLWWFFFFPVAMVPTVRFFLLVRYESLLRIGRDQGQRFQFHTSRVEFCSMVHYEGDKPLSWTTPEVEQYHSYHMVRTWYVHSWDILRFPTANDIRWGRCRKDGKVRCKWCRQGQKRREDAAAWSRLHYFSILSYFSCFFLVT